MRLPDAIGDVPNAYMQVGREAAIGNMESIGLTDAKLAAEPSKLSGEQHHWAEWKVEVAICAQVIDGSLPDEVQKMIGSKALTDLDQASAEDIKKGSSSMW